MNLWTYTYTHTKPQNLVINHHYYSAEFFFFCDENVADNWCERLSSWFGWKWIYQSQQQHIWRDWYLGWSWHWTLSLDKDITPCPGISISYVLDLLWLCKLGVLSWFFMSIVQWFPGHIAKAEKELKEQLKLMDVVIEVRDGRIPMSTTHPQACSVLFNFIW